MTRASRLSRTDRNGNVYTCGPTDFSTAADYGGTPDGAAQFHLLGTAPARPDLSPGGGGDCALATGIKKNARGNYQLAYAASAR